MIVAFKTCNKDTSAYHGTSSFIAPFPSVEQTEGSPQNKSLDTFLASSHDLSILVVRRIHGPRHSVQGSKRTLVCLFLVLIHVLGRIVRRCPHMALVTPKKCPSMGILLHFGRTWSRRDLVPVNLAVGWHTEIFCGRLGGIVYAIVSFAASSAAR